VSKLYHLSHIDLDGYGCQYLTSQMFDNIALFNANYGPEVQARLNEIIITIKSSDATDNLILISDLNLTPKEAKWIENEVKKIGVDLLLLDHHITGQNSSQEYDWYHLNTDYSATKLTYNWLKKEFDFDGQNNFGRLVESINAVDMWHSTHELFEFGKVMMSMIAGAKEIGKVMFPEEDSRLKHHIIETAYQYINQNDCHIKLDDNAYRLKKDFFFLDHNDTKDNLVAQYITSLLGNQKERFTIYYKDFKGILGYNIGNSSIIGNKFLIENSDYNFYMDINFRGHFSLRGNGTLDLSEVAQKIGNGGGHPNASGGKIENFKDSFVYSDVKKFVQEHINQKIKF
jgi:oligoribonuclease NrnB/cAMP/cGMP phosphodiesterase (DHH superfamily)